MKTATTIKTKIKKKHQKQVTNDKIMVKVSFGLNELSTSFAKNDGGR